MENEVLTFSDYLANKKALEQDMLFCGIADNDREAIQLAAAEILLSSDLTQKLASISDALLGTHDEWNTATEKYMLSEAPRSVKDALSTPETLSNANAFCLIFPALYNLASAKRAYQERGIPECILQDAMQDIPRWIDTFAERTCGRYRGFAELGWLREHLSMRLFQLGRLQFQPGSFPKAALCLKNKNDGSLKLVKADEDFCNCEWDVFCSEGDPILNVHIPAGSKLDPISCEQSFEVAPAFFKKYFGDRPQPKAFLCSSWLLYEDFEKILPPTSNIVAFNRLFTCGLPSGGDDSFYERIFLPYGRSISQEQLKTTLQKVLFEHIRQGNTPHGRIGIRPVEEPRTLRIGVLGSGSGSNMQSIQDAIEAGTLNAKIVTVISDVPGAKILDRAARHGIPNSYMDPAPFKTKLEGKAEDEVIRVLKEANVDVVVLAGYMRVVKPKLLAAFPNRVLNIHPAILPSFPGIAGWKQALDYGAKVAGCTVHFVNAGIDSGPIIVQRVVDVMDNDTPETLHARIQVEEHIAYPEAIRLLASHALHISGRKVIRL